MYEQEKKKFIDILEWIGNQVYKNDSRSIVEILNQAASDFDVPFKASYSVIGEVMVKAKPRRPDRYVDTESALSDAVNTFQHADEEEIRFQANRIGHHLCDLASVLDEHGYVGYWNGDKYNEFIKKQKEKQNEKSNTSL